MNRPGTWLRRSFVVAALAVLTLLVGAPAGNAQFGEKIVAFDAVLTANVDGSLDVTETITYDFGSNQRHGIFRYLFVRYDVGPNPVFELPEGRQPDDVWRVFEVDDIEVTSDTAPDEIEVTRPDRVSGDRTLTIRIGDPDRTITGVHTYRIDYTVRGAYDSPTGVPELYWNVTGNDWSVPMDRVTVDVRGVGVTDVNCFRGFYGSTQTCDARIGGNGQAAAQASLLLPGEGVTLAVRFPEGSIQDIEPIFQDKWDIVRAFVGSGSVWWLTVLTALLGLGGVGLLAFRQGRDRVTAGDVTVDGRVRTGASTQERRRGLFEPRAVGVQYRPPDNLRPAQLGLIIDESVDPVDVSATIVDLAVRGYLVIEEMENKVLWFSKTDWKLRRTDPSERSDRVDEVGELQPYEQKLLDALFESGDEVDVSDLKGDFASDYRKVADAIYDDGQRRRWFNRRPDKTRTMWQGIGGGAVAVSIGLLVVAVIFTTVALAVIPLIIAAFMLLTSNKWMPRRTPKGSRLLTQTLGFKEFITEAETGRMEFAEEENLFVKYLPYAVVFGAVDKWAQTFAALGIATATGAGAWYVSSGGFDSHRFSSGLSDFSTTVGSSLSYSPSSSGSGGFSGGGFSGGGGGGGGGGSW